MTNQCNHFRLDGKCQRAVDLGSRCPKCTTKTDRAWRLCAWSKGHFDHPVLWLTDPSEA